MKGTGRNLQQILLPSPSPCHHQWNKHQKNPKQLKSFFMLVSSDPVSDRREIVKLDNQIPEHSDTKFLHGFQCKEEQ